MALSVGTVAPAFKTQDTLGHWVSLSDFAGKTVVLYFYPKDDTPGCTKEACSFRDSYDRYLSQGIPVLGVSRDDVASHQAFTAKFNLPFPLLVDTDGVITNAYDVAGERNGFHYSLRVTYVIGPDGAIQQVYDAVQTETHAADILTDLGL
jgi:thioredoxin-dependent peroxiredoxin